MNIPSGIPFIDDYHALIKSSTFQRLESFSNSFVHENKKVLSNYSKKWILDPLHTYNRQWEYPYVAQRVSEYAQSMTCDKMNILDAGCGVTFFPFFLRKQFNNSHIDCCDHNPLFEKLFTSLKSYGNGVRYNVEDLKSFDYADESFHIIYCISVLEHTGCYKEIIREFKRILKPEGLLILTFDVSIDGSADISPSAAEELLKILENNFEQASDCPAESLSETINKSDIVSTKYIKTWDKNLLPWKYPFLSALKSALQKGCIPKGLMKNLTLYCETYRKRNIL